MPGSSFPPIGYPPVDSPAPVYYHPRMDQLAPSDHADPPDPNYYNFNRCGKCLRPMVMVEVDKMRVEGMVIQIPTVAVWKHWAPLVDQDHAAVLGDKDKEREVVGWR